MAKAKTSMVIGIATLVGIGGIVLLTSKAKAEPIVYICPIDGLEFDTLEELQAHFTEAHPREKIPILWG